ncbi:hypothetical protein, partial [Actinobacillus pleuropneumoniae]
VPYRLQEEDCNTELKEDLPCRLKKENHNRELEEDLPFGSQKENHKIRNHIGLRKEMKTMWVM